MTIQEIKDIFDIDITEKEKKTLNVYLRTLYTHKNRPFKTLTAIAKELNLTHSSLIHSMKKLETYKTDPLFMYVAKAFETKDIELIYEYKRLEEKKVYLRKHLTYKQFMLKVNLEKPKKLIKEKYYGEADRISDDFSEVKRVGILEVAEKLRFKKTELNNKPFTAWTGRDWKNYHKITIE